MLTAQDIADMIDHFLLRPELADEEVREGCRIFERAEGRLKVGRDPG
jgi:deoxyribose-phosphate aldolase